MAVGKVSDATFETEVLKANGPVVVDFWAEWCGPCRTIAPALDEIAASYSGKLTVAKVNVDENPVTPNRFAVRGIPTLMIFKGGQPVATKMGADSKGNLTAWVDANL